MNLELNIASLRVGDVISAVASPSVAPGAGAAAAVCLGLAAACAGKAVAISLKHRLGDDTLSRARDQLTEMGRHALAGADEDANRFEEFIHDKDMSSAVRLIRAGERLQRLAAELTALLDTIEPMINASVTSDITAARALRDAFVAIQAQNIEESRNAAAALEGGGSEE